MEIIKVAQALLRRERLSKWLPYVAYDDATEIYTLDQGVGFIMECIPIPFASDTHMLTLRSIFENTFPVGSSIQFMLYASPNVYNILDNYVYAREAAHGDSIYTELAKKKRDFFLEGTSKSLFKGFDMRVRDFRLIVSFVLPCPKTPTGIDNGRKTAIGIKHTVTQALSAAHLAPTNMNPDLLINFLSELLNPNHSFQDVLKYDPAVEIHEQILFADSPIEVNKKQLFIDDKVCKSLSIKLYPDEWDISRGLNLCGHMLENAKQIAAPFFITLNCEFPNSHAESMNIKKKTVMAGHQAEGGFAKMFPLLVTKKRNFDIFNDLLNDGQVPFFTYMHMFLYGDNIEHAAQITQSADTLLRSMNFIPQQDTFISLPLFLQSLPCGYLSETKNAMQRYRTVPSGTMPHLAPIQADYKGQGAPALLLVSRRGQLQSFDVFASKAAGYSAIVAGMTGTGKSFFMQEFITSYLGLGTRVWVLDKGRSYWHHADALGGDFVEFGPSSKVNINPFTNVLDLTEEMSMLKDIVAVMASDIPLDRADKSSLEEAIGRAWEAKGNAMTVTDVAVQLRKEGGATAEKLAKGLFPFTAKGSYASYFEGPSTLSTKNLYSVYELEDLKNKKDLQEVVLLSTIYQIQQEVARDRSERKMVIIDESFDLLGGGKATEFITTAYRRFRKMKASCVAVNQGINDFYRLEVGDVIMENSAYKFLLCQNAESIAAIKKSQRLAFTDGMYEMLKTVHTQENNYSEIFVYTPVTCSIGRLVADRYTQLLYSSLPSEFTAIEKLRENGMNVKDAINTIIQRELAA